MRACLNDLFDSVQHLRPLGLYDSTYGLAADAYGRITLLLVAQSKKWSPFRPSALSPYCGTESSWTDVAARPRMAGVRVFDSFEAAIRLLNFPALFPTEDDIDEIIREGS